MIEARSDSATLTRIDASTASSVVPTAAASRNAMSDTTAKPAVDVAPAATTKVANCPGSGARLQVYYHIDDQPTPYCTEVHVAPDKITLGDFKGVLNRSNFKYYCKAVDPEVGDVKAEIRDDGQVLQRSSNGQFELFLLTAEGSDPGVHKLLRHHIVPGPAPVSLYPLGSAQYRLAVQQFDQSMASTDSESMISALPAGYVKGAINRHHLQQQYLVQHGG